MSALVREYVDQALSSLSKAVPIVVFIEGEAGRSFWAGLKNAELGTDQLPGAMSHHDDVAVVRCASGALVPRPTHRNHGAMVKDTNQPNLPRAELYEHVEGGVTSWLLAQPSRVHRSAAIGARAGTQYTRWTLPAVKAKWQALNWHALTAIEIVVARAGSWDPRELAALTARLCEQAASWDDRTQLPAPLHLAKSSDDDHPGNPPALSGGEDN